MKILGNLTFTDLGDSEIRNAIMERLAGGVDGATLPASGGDIGSPGIAAGRIVFNTDENIYYYWDGATWKKLATGGDATALQAEVDAIEATLGINTDGTSNIASWTLNSITVGSPGETSFKTVIESIDAALLESTSSLVTYVGSGSPAATSPDYSTNFFVTDGDDLTTAIGKLDLALSASNQLVELLDVDTNLGSPANDLSAQESYMFRYDPTGSPYATWTLDSLTLGSLNDVAAGIDLAGTEDILAFDGTQWTAITPGTFANELLIQDLGNVVAGSPATFTTGDLLQWDGASFEPLDVNSIVSGQISLSDLSDVTGSAGAVGTSYVLVSDGTGFVTTDVSTAPATFVEAIEDTIWGALESTGSPLASRHGSISISYDDAAGEFTFDVDDVFVRNDGDTMTGNLNMTTNYVLSSSAPTLDNHLTNKAYVDSLVAGLSWKDAVRLAYSDNVNLATGGLIGDNIGGSPNTTPVAGDRVLVMGQTDPTENGIYIVVDGGAWTRATDMDEAVEFDGAAVFVQEGAWESAGFTQSETVTTVGTDTVAFSQFTGGAVFTWGDGLVAVGNTINVNLGAGIAQFPADEVGVDIYDYDNATNALGFTNDGSTRVATESVLATDDELFLFVDESTLTQLTGTLKVKASGITGVELNASVAGDALALETIGGSPLTGYELNVKVDGTTITTTGDQLQVVSTLTVETDDEIGSPGVSGFDVAPNGTFTIAGGTGITTSDDAAGTVTITRDAMVTEELTDVTAGATAAGQVMVAGAGPDNDYTPRQIQYIGDFASATTWTVTHNLGQQWVNVTIVDSTTEVIIPESISMTSSTVTTVTFNTPVAGKAIIMGVAGVAAV